MSSTTTVTPLGKRGSPAYGSVVFPTAGVTPAGVAALSRLVYTSNNDVLSVNATTLVLGRPQSLVSINGGVNISTDNAVKQTSQFWSTPSDRRIKERIRPVEVDPAFEAKFLEYRVKRYFYAPEFIRDHGFSEADQIGLIADEALESHPATVVVTPLHPDYGLEDFKTVNPHSIFYEMLAIVQSHSRRIAELEAELARIKILKV